MKDDSVDPTSWKHVGLAVLPGIWLIFQQTTDAPLNISPLREGMTLGITIVIALGLVLASLHVYRRLEVWCLPAFGILLWKADEFVVWWAWAVRRGIEPASSIGRILEYSGVWSIAYRTSLVLAIFGIAISMFCGVAFWLWWLYKSRRGIPRWSWGLMGVIVVMVCGSAGLFLLPLFMAAAGSLWAKKEGLGASLLFLGSVPEWLNIALLSAGLYPAFFQAVLQQDPVQTRLQMALSSMIYLSFLCFLVAVPIGLLRSHSTRQQQLWMLLPPLLTLVSVAIVSTVGLSGLQPEAESTSYLILRVIVVLTLWLPLPLMAVLYDSQHHHRGPATESSAAALDRA